jgi:predicted dehydrogenase
MTAVSWGVIGTGDISKSISSDLALVPDAHRAVVASRSADRASEFAAEFGFDRSVGSVDELLADPAVDIVYVATPHATHKDLAIRALRAGKHVLIEKPVGVDAAEAREVADESQRQGRFAMEAMWMKFNPTYRRLLDELRDGTIGELRSVRASFGIAFPPGVGSRWSAEMHGSTLLDQGIYPITLALDTLGAPTSITSVGRMTDDGIDLSEHVTLEFEGGRFAQLAASMVEWIDPTASLNGTTGWVHVPFPFWATDRYSVFGGRTLFDPRVEIGGRTGQGYVPMLVAVQDALGEGLIEHPAHPWSAVDAVFGVMDTVRAQLRADRPA